ncbi:MAG: signal peptide peptidase SppA [bacterium]|nr:signal peptide peptidase SppA [bacterium]
MKTVSILLIFLTLSMATFAQNNQPPQIKGIGLSTHPMTTHSGTSGILSLWGNPAGVATYGGAGFVWMLPMDSTNYLKDFTAAVKLGGFAFSGEWKNDVPQNTPKTAVYHMVMSAEINDGIYFGSRYRFSKNLPWQNEWSVGLLTRPYSWLSIGATAKNINQTKVLNEKTKPSYDFGFALRPLAWMSWKHSHRITLATDVTIYEENSTLVTNRNPVKYGDKLNPRFFLEIEPVNGLKLQTQYASDDKELKVGLALATDQSAVMHSVRTKDGKMVGGYSGTLYEDELLTLPIHLEKFLVKMKVPITLEEEKTPFSFFSKPQPQLENFLKKIRRLSKDPQVVGLVLEIEEIQYPMSTLQAVMRELKQFKKEGKKIYVYSKSMSNRSYALATIADKIYLHPEGEVFLIGFATSGLYLKKTLDKLGIEMEVEASGPHKTAPNMFTEDRMTEEDRAQREWLVGDLYRQFVEMIATNRNWTIEKTKEIIDNGPYLSEEAIQVKLIDSTIYEDQIETVIQEAFTGKKVSDKESKLLFVKMHKKDDIEILNASEYFEQPDIDPRWDRPLEPKIAVIYAVGSITTGKSDPGGFLNTKTMGSETMVKLIRNARKNKQVKAIVLRIDSPGGSGFASDEIWRELMLCKTDEKTRKPVIVSMASMAASGGYYIAIPADTIVAEEGTITGSIGVFAMRPVIDSTLKKIGTNYEEIKFSKRAGMFNIMRRHTPDERKVVETMVKEFYRKFVQKVADGRNMKWEQVDSIGNGRVWTGMQGYKNGLVDTLGGLDLAIEIAKQAAKIPDRIKPDVIVYSRPSGWDPMVEMQTLVYRALPESVRSSIQKAQAIKNIEQGGVLLLAPDWVRDEVIQENDAFFKR